MLGRSLDCREWLLEKFWGGFPTRFFQVEVHFMPKGEAECFSVKIPGELEMKMETQAGFPTGESLSAFSALHLLRNYNQLLLPPEYNLIQVYHSYPCGTSIGDLSRESFPHSPTLPYSPLAGALHSYPHYSLPAGPDLKSRQALLSAAALCRRRPRGEKRPIPDDQKDDRYYERRKRNNQAAKKSRDARKLREDQVALRATLLEHENAILRAQLLTLREETESLRQLLWSQKKSCLGPPQRKEGGEKAMEFGKKWEPDFELHAVDDMN